VGAYAITATLSGPVSNYSVTSKTGTLTVTPAPLTVTALNSSKAFGDPLPLFAITSAGYVVNDTPQTVLTGILVFATAATATSNVGTYPVTPGGLTAANYSITFLPGALTIVQAQPAFSNLTSVSIPAGTASTNLSGTIGYAGIAPTGSVSIKLNSVTQPATIAANGGFSSAFATAALAVGSYPISYTYPGDANFKAATGTGTLSVSGFVPTGSMGTARSFHTATLLASGKVLVAGGLNASGAPLASAEVYDPATGVFTPTANNMPNKASGHTATLLSNGKVILVGGGNSSSQLYDPATNSWSSSGGSGQRSNHAAVLLANGKVLITGGTDNSGKSTNTAQLYDPATGTFTSTGNMSTSRAFHTASLLPDGTVLIAGGRTIASTTAYLSSAEIYNPATGTFAPTANNMSTARSTHTAVMYNSKILIAGGTRDGSTSLASAELYDFVTKLFTVTGSMGQARQYFTTTVANAAVLAVGGLNGTTVLAGSETYQTSVFASAGAMTAARYAHTATLLSNGSVLITGGTGAGGAAIATAELYKAP
jgi:hypothetical protein